MMTTFGKLWTRPTVSMSFQNQRGSYFYIAKLSKNMKSRVLIKLNDSLTVWSWLSVRVLISLRRERQIRVGRVCLSWPVRAVGAMSGYQLLDSSFSENVALCDGATFMRLDNIKTPFGVWS